MKDFLVHFHLYYFDQVDFFIEKLMTVKNYPNSTYDLFVTMREHNKDAEDKIKAEFPDAKFIICKNVGADIWPFIVILNQVNLGDYKYIVKVHTKRWVDVYQRLAAYGVEIHGWHWRDMLLTFLQPQNFTKIIHSFEKNKKLGMVGDYRLMHTEYGDDVETLKKARMLMQQCHYNDIRYVAGTMFVARAGLFQPVKDLEFQESDFASFQSGKSSQLAHVMERFLGCVIVGQGYDIADTYTAFRKIKQVALMTTNKLRLYSRLFYVKTPDAVKYRLFGLTWYKKKKEATGLRRVYFLRIPVFKYTNRQVAREYQQTMLCAGQSAPQWFDDLKLNKSHFVPITDKPFVRTEKTPKIFAYYLPQFHSIPENDDAHGLGFTEWTNVAGCLPQFVGHVQPRVPYDVGFYNLKHVDVMYRQAELAKMYGVYGWCFYYYWFSGRQVLETPLKNFLASDIDMKFHLCWANENWSKLWDGGDKEVILKQEYKDGDADKFFDDILPFIQDKRYEKIGNKPILMIYNPKLFTKTQMKEFMNTLNKRAIAAGFDGLYFTASNFLDFNTPTEWGFDAITEFPPHGLRQHCKPTAVQKTSEKSIFSVVNIDEYLESQAYLYDAQYTVFKACFPSWDNSPRKAYSGGTCFIMTADKFENWLTGIIKWTRQNNNADKQYVYINAWNEWAEGAVLEPDTRNGYKYLSIVKKCLEK